MSFKILKSTGIILCLTSCVSLVAGQNLVNYGRWSKAEIAQLISTVREIDGPGDRIVAVSRHFIDTPYVADTLIGDPQTAEQLVINLAGFDCFTFLDVVEALRRSSDITDFSVQLKQVRYRDDEVAYQNRRHFFSDWIAGDSGLVGDVTLAVGQGRAQTIVKQLNLKSEGAYWLSDIPVSSRAITYIPTTNIDEEVLSTLHVGDYVGIYSNYAGLDVSHTGLIVKDKDSVMLRHASSGANLNRVVDVNLLEYLQGKPGLVVYRVW